ncbi:MAG TPA: ATP-binding protein, partial [Permianibacter sp.]|nr:ATP-binding protein [Permianibacter sp.]
HTRGAVRRARPDAVRMNKKILPRGFAEALVRGRRWVILGMLLSLHAGLVSAAGGDFQRVWMLVHFGLFLLWQPLFNTDRELEAFAALLLLGIGGVILYAVSGWSQVLWLAILIGIMGGKVFTAQAARRTRFYLVAVFYLFTMLLLWTVPTALLGINVLPQGLSIVVEFFLPLSLLAMLFLPFRAEDEASTQIFDFFYSLIVFQLVVVLVLGSIAAMRVTENQYFQAVVLTVLVFSGALFALAVLWAPRTGFGGLRTYFSRYLLSVGMPFELWMRRIAELSEADSSPARFLESAMAEVERFPWIVGARWQSPEGNGSFGRETEHESRFHYHQLEAVFYTGIRLSPAMFLHLRLLAQVIGEFHEGKRRENLLKQHAYMQAVHETGAKLTHDIKNLLQSLYALTTAGLARAENDRRSKSEYQAMLERQLPHLAKRLQTTLDKLQNPQDGAANVMLQAATWWSEAQTRHEHEPIEWSASGELAATVPSNLFDTVLENCLENLRKKKIAEPNLTIRVALNLGDGVRLSITDTGNPIPSGAVEQLFNAPVSSNRRSGLGIGLYQAARQAERLGFALRLSDNRAGKVTFELAKQAAKRAD